MKKYYIINGKKGVFETSYEIDNLGYTEQDYRAGKRIEVSKKQAQFYKNNLSANFSEIMSMEMMPPPPPVEIPIEEQLKNMIVSKIREEYDIDDELAILRKRDIETVKFAEYANFCEQCKADARLELSVNEQVEELTSGEISKLASKQKNI